METVEEEIYGDLMVVSAISYTVNPSVALLEGILVMQLIMHSLWPPTFRTEYVLLFVRYTEMQSFCEQDALLLLKNTFQK